MVARHKAWSVGKLNGSTLEDHALYSARRKPAYQRALYPNGKPDHVDRPWTERPGRAAACEYPIARNGPLTWDFCACPDLMPGSSYCEKHHKLCHLEKIDEE